MPPMSGMGRLRRGEAPPGECPERAGCDAGPVFRCTRRKVRFLRLADIQTRRVPVLCNFRPEAHEKRPSARAQSGDVLLPGDGPKLFRVPGNWLLLWRISGKERPNSSIMLFESLLFSVLVATPSKLHPLAFCDFRSLSFIAAPFR